MRTFEFSGTKRSPDAHPAASVEKVIHRSIQEFERIKADPSRYIDEGGAAKVFAISDSVCMKALHDRHTSPHAKLFKLGNTLREEAIFLERLTGFTVGHARTPSYIGLLEGTEPGEPNIIFMERLDAVNLQAILRGTEPAPDAFDGKAFFDELERYILALHSVHKIVHGDLEARNVMVDRKTGMPRVIDFGRSRFLARLPKHEQDKYMDQDLNNIDAMYQAWKSCNNLK